MHAHLHLEMAREEDAAAHFRAQLVTAAEEGAKRVPLDNVVHLVPFS
eukprot:COSAG01_NODE_1334_length_10681_cov_10.259025_7_plen_47_part_00